MADNQNHQLNPDQIRNLLSPYLDGEVTDEERTLVEQALAVSAELQSELETLQRTVALVAALPPIPAPRPFTLTEADVRGTAPAPKSLFGLPSWVKGWAVLATTLLCVLAAGGLFWNMQFGGGSRQAAAPAAEVANAPQLAATATTAEVQSAAAPAESAAQKEAEAVPTDAESMAKTEAATAEEAAPAAEESMADAAQEKTMPATLTAAASPVAALAAPPADEVAEETAPVGEVTTAESQAITATEADQSAPAEGAAGGAVPPPSPAPLPTASPAPQTLTFAAPATEAVEEEAASAAEAENEQAAAQSAAPPAPAEPAEPGLQERGILPRSIQVENLSLKITPGLIQIEGNIEATPGSILLATLQRNSEPFDNWADPASLQTVVQPNGQFSLIIQASAGRTDQDLFAIEPANYQLTLTSLDGAGPVVAVVPFDTFRPAEIPSATPPPPASATPVAQLTLVPSVTTPIETATAIATSLPEAVSPTIPNWLIGAGMAALVIIIGLVVWLIRHNKN